jgi:hypothetical protein
MVVIGSVSSLDPLIWLSVLLDCLHGLHMHTCKKYVSHHHTEWRQRLRCLNWLPRHIMLLPLEGYSIALICVFCLEFDCQVQCEQTYASNILEELRGSTHDTAHRSPLLQSPPEYSSSKLQWSSHFGSPDNCGVVWLRLRGVVYDESS